MCDSIGRFGCMGWRFGTSDELFESYLRITPVLFAGFFGFVRFRELLLRSYSMPPRLAGLTRACMRPAIA